MTGLHNLPVELVHEIHLLAVNPHLAIVSAWLRELLHGLPPTLRACWLIRYAESRASRHNTANIPNARLPLSQVMEASIRHAICTSDVVSSIPRVWRLYYHSTDPSQEGFDMPMPNHPPPVDLPRWLFAHLCICGEAPDDTHFCGLRVPGKGKRALAHLHNTNTPLHRRHGKMMTVQEVLGILHALCTQSHNSAVPSRRNFIINVNSFKGAPLIYSCGFGATEIVRFLLAHGADPNLQGGAAVRAAVRRRGLPLVRTLVERSPQGCSTCLESKPPDPSFDPCDSQGALDRRAVELKRGKACGSQMGAKRRRLCDRVEITPDLVNEAIRVDARDVVHYFMTEKGCSPAVQTLGRALFK